MRRSLFLVAVVLAVAAILPRGLTRPETGKAENPDVSRLPRLLPGLQPGGEVLLPNQWSVRPAGKQYLLGDFPINTALHPEGKFLAVLHTGYGDHEVVIFDLARGVRLSRFTIDQAWYGLCFSPDGKKLFASGGENEVVHTFDFQNGQLNNHKTLTIVDQKKTFIPGGLAVSPDGKTLFAAGTWGNAIAILPLEAPDKVELVQLPEKDSYPYACLPDSDGQRVFISLWNKSQVAVLDVARRKVTATWKTENHPTEMALFADAKKQKTLFVACANSTRVSVIDAGTGKSRQTIVSALYPNAPAGNTPNSLALTPDGQVLFVANADNNNLGVFNVADLDRARPMGFIPTGWYPTSVRYDARAKKLYVANGKGGTSKANRHGPNPTRSSSPTTEYIAGLLQGTLSIIDMPTPGQLEAYTRQVYELSPLRKDRGVTARRPEGNPIPAKVGDPSPIKYVIYIIKENRTYDQVFGDMKEGNGDPNLCLFPERVTPNHHKLARQFVLLDNFYVEGEVSADGHQWSMAAYCTDYVEKVWPLIYRGPKTKGKFPGYPSEGSNPDIETPAGGYLWDRCKDAGVSYRSYGEWITNGKTPDDPGKARVPALEGHFDPKFRGYDLDYPDVKRAERFISELKRFEREGGMPRLSIVRLPNDHTYGTRVDKLTPTAYVADNDLALGMLVEAVTKSKFWKETAIFVVEDDAQNGPDHVDAHRTVALVISPYTRRRYVDSTMYSTASMLRTIGLILGLRPMSQFDAAARPMYASFQARPDYSGYEHVVPRVDMKEKNKKTAWGSDLSEKFNLAVEDAADDLLFNEVIWRSVKGPDSPMPPPVRAAFFVPRVKGGS